MKRFAIGALVVMIFLVSSVPRGYGAGSMIVPPKGAGDPTAVLLMKQGIDLYGEGKWEEALSSLTLASQVDPSLSAAYFNAGVVAWEMGRAGQALSSLETFLGAHPGHQEAQRLLSDVRKSYYSGRSSDSAGGGFAEFGAATLLGFIFVFAVAVHEIAATHPLIAAEEGTADDLERLWRGLKRAA